MLFVATIGISGQILLKKGLNSFSHLQFNSFLSKIFTIVFEPFVLLALFCYAVGMIDNLFLLSKVELTSVYPIYTSLTFWGLLFRKASFKRTAKLAKDFGHNFNYHRDFFDRTIWLITRTI
jgi:hypothetical protein